LAGLSGGGAFEKIAEEGTTEFVVIFLIYGGA
jgi:hypothetical protein